MCALFRQGDATVRATYEVLMHDLVKNHAEIRLSTFQLIGHIFTRSYLFRELLILDFKKFASLVTGTDPKLPLPPPKDVAARLKKSSLLAIRDWNQKYGSSYPKLKLGFNYLKFNKKVRYGIWELVFDPIQCTMGKGCISLSSEEGSSLVNQKGSLGYPTFPRPRDPPFV